MPRVRISTTVDGDRLQRCRALLGVSDSQLLDRAIAALLDRLVAEHEVAALDAQPYETDPDLAWAPEPGPDLPYDGHIPEDVQALAAARRRRR
ncbi:MAG: antitoxin MazE5 [Actinobacteria bacterium]|nr:antitoxin MazE5 [Actinomycetota bacterium]